MTNAQLYSQILRLPASLKKEVSDFVEFLLSKHKKKEIVVKREFGCAQDKFTMTQDFDEPLGDFKDYMY